jgi:hypothetical protein
MGSDVIGLLSDYSLCRTGKRDPAILNIEGMEFHAIEMPLCICCNLYGIGIG